MPSIEECLEIAKEIIATDLEVAFQEEATRAIQGHKTVFPTARTGFLIGNIQAKATPDGVEVSFPSYAQYLEFGTGLYGPKHQKIVPKDKEVLAFKSGGKMHYFKSVKGMRPAPFIRPVMHQKFVDIIVNALNIAFKEVDLPQK